MARHMQDEWGSSVGLAAINDGWDGHRRVLAVYDAAIAEMTARVAPAPAPGEWGTLEVDLPEPREVWTDDGVGAEYMALIEPAVRRARAYGLSMCWAHGENAFVQIACVPDDPSRVVCEAFRTLPADEGDHPDMVGLSRVRFRATLREPLEPGVQYAPPPIVSPARGIELKVDVADEDAAE